MEHDNHLRNNGQAIWGNLQPGVECSDELSPQILAWVLRHVVVGTHQDLLFFLRPHSVPVFRPVDT